MAARIAADGAEAIARVGDAETHAPTFGEQLAAQYEIESTAAAIASGGFASVRALSAARSASRNKLKSM